MGEERNRMVLACNSKTEDAARRTPIEGTENLRLSVSGRAIAAGGALAGANAARVE